MKLGSEYCLRTIQNPLQRPLTPRVSINYGRKYREAWVAPVVNNSGHKPSASSEPKAGLTYSAKQVAGAGFGFVLGVSLIAAACDDKALAIGVSFKGVDINFVDQSQSTSISNSLEIPEIKYGKLPFLGVLRIISGKNCSAEVQPWKLKRDEGIGYSQESTYGQILQGRNDTANRESMYTEDAWEGMLGLRRYDELLASVVAEEKLCPECTKNRRLLEQVWQTVSNEYYDQYGSFSQASWAGKLYDSLSGTGGILRTRKDAYKVIKKMIESLGDRYSAFLEPQEYRLAIRRPIPSEIKYLTYQYTGVGVALGKKSPSGGLTIVSPFAGSPAEEAGILAGERLMRIDGLPVDSLSAEEAVNLLRGPEGSLVELEITGLQPGDIVRRVILERRSLPLPPLRVSLVDPGDGRVLQYMRLHYFTHEATKSMAAAIRDGEALGVDGYILDLRNNPGGVFEEAIAMAALWLDCEGCDVAETVRSSVGTIEDLVYSVNNLPKEIFFRHPGMLTHAPIAIITNRSSASASEVLTGALHDNHRAVVVGERTFGKGVVQYFFPMDDGSGLKLTVEKYLTPARYDISKQGGLEPDKKCTDFPHQSGQLDGCIDEALELLGSKRQRPAFSERLPYRWLPFSESWTMTHGTY